jgi:hypothetical protein
MTEHSNKQVNSLNVELERTVRMYKKKSKYSTKSTSTSKHNIGNREKEKINK